MASQESVAEADRYRGLSENSLDRLPVGIRKRGRPRKTWTDTVLKTAFDIAGSNDEFQSLMAPTAQAHETGRAAVNVGNVYINSL